MNDREQRFAGVLAAHGAGLGRVVASYARPSDQDDLGQEIALAIWNALPSFRADASERTFVFRIAHNRGLTFLARRRAASEEVPEVTDGAPGPEALAAGREGVERLFVAIRALSCLVPSGSDAGPRGSDAGRDRGLPGHLGRECGRAPASRPRRAPETTGGIMTDNEWQSWKQTFREGGKPMPRIVERARTDRRRALLGIAGFYAILAVELWWSIPALRSATSAAQASSPLVVILSVAVLAVGFHVAMRGTWRRSEPTPRALIDALESRHLSRRRLMRFLPWGTAFALVGTLGSVAWQFIAAGHADRSTAIGTVVVCVVTLGLVWLAIRQTNAFVDRELREVAQARKLLDEAVEE